jgi:acetyltransferase-like isoleucine patch superfamily enzyme
MIKVIIFLIKNIRIVINLLKKNYNQFIKSYIDFLYLRYYGVETKHGYVILQGLPLIHKHPNAKIIIGKNTILVSKSKYNSAGINHPVILAAIRKNAILNIHGSFSASGTSIVAMNHIEILEGTGVGVNSSIYDTDFHPVGWKKNSTIKTSPIKVGKNVWISANCLILKGVTIGDNAVIGAGSVVTKNIDSDSVYAGNPAKFIKKI